MRRGFALVLCLLLSTFLFVLVLVFLGQRNPYHATAQGQRQAARALSLAEAGLEDFRGKLCKDLRFPPLTSPDHPEFTYSEQLSEEESFVIRLDHSLKGPPYWVYRVWSTGVVGPPNRPTARRTVYAEIDNCPFLRGDPAQESLVRYQILHMREGEERT